MSGAWESVLAGKGLYSTRERRKAWAALAASQKPLTARQLHERMGVGTCDLATVHRTLKQFERFGIIHSISFDGRSRWYERKDQSGHHHHVFCTLCGRIEDIPMCHVHDFADYAQKKIGFEIKAHSFELFGLCPDCRWKREGNRPRKAKERFGPKPRVFEVN